MMSRLAICFGLALLWVGCAAFSASACPAHGTSVPAIPEAQLRAAWVARYGALPSPACDAHWAWSVVTPDELAQSCTHVSACTIYPAGCPLTMTTASYAQSRELNTHEIAHWYLLCSTGDGDAAHTRVDVWGPGAYDGMFGS